jgi:hypothetical protein
MSVLRWRVTDCSLPSNMSLGSCILDLVYDFNIFTSTMHIIKFVVIRSLILNILKFMGSLFLGY